MNVSRKQLIAACWWTSVSVLISGCSERSSFPAAGSAARFDVVLITLDTTRADRLGAYGYEKAQTPHLDRLAREGIRFDDAVSPAPLTLVSHASMLTGLDPDRHGVRHNGQYRLDATHLTLAEVLSRHGYETAAFVSAFVLDARYGLAQGFDHYDDRVETLPGQPFGGLGERSAEAVTDSILEWLPGRSRDRPLFLWAHYYDPHADYDPPDPFAQRFDNPYDGEIAYMDSQVGRLLDALEHGGARTVVIVAGDHGESFGEHGEHAHSRFVYESTQRVPLIVWSGELIRGPLVVDNELVGLVDIFPTVLDLLGIDQPGRRDGVSLRSEPGVGERRIYVETMASYLDNGWAPLYGLRRQKDKYILAPRPEYYDLEIDPGESENLFTRRGEEVTPLAEELALRLEETPAFEAVARAAIQPDAESLRRLQALGYLSGPGPSSLGVTDSSSSVLPDPKDMMGVQRLLMESRGLRKQGRLEEALGKARRAMEEAPSDLEVLEENGLLHVEMNELERAEEAFRAYSRLKANPNIYILLAEILKETGRKPEGVTLLKQAMELEPDHGGVMITWGDFLADDGKYEEALDWYQKAKLVDPYRATTVANKHIVELRRRLSGS